MATSQDGGSAGLADAATSAREFVAKRVRDADAAVSPSELAAEYGCGNQHMQNVCSELTADEVIERIREGEYVRAGEVSPESDESDTEQDMGESGEESGEASSSESGESDTEQESGGEREPPRPSADGAPRSEDTDIDGEAVGAAAAGAAAAGVPFLFGEDGPDVKLVLAAAVGVVVLWLLLRDDSGDTSSGSGASSESETSEESGAESSEPTTGVIGGLNE
jgi:cobalamin biosynthesis Mg chelatase CobN